MGKKKSWFTYVKRLFIHESKPKPEKKSKNRRWFIERLKFKHYPAIEAPQGTLDDAAEERRKHARAVAIATAAAAEAAVAAANAAAEVVRLTNISYELERKNLNLAAIRIQTYYRGYLARKALSALRGIVKLQAVVRGELVRRNVIKILVSMSLLSGAQPLPCRTRVPTHLEHLGQGKRIKSEELKLQINPHRSWDLSLQKAMTLKENRRSNQFDQRAESSIHQLEETQKLKPISHSNTIEFDTSKLAQLKLRTACKKEATEDLNSPFSLPRRSFCHAKPKPIGDDESLPDILIFPGYMAATESARAKSRSSSTPKQRLRLSDTYSCQHSPSKISFSSWSSFNSEITRTNKRNSISQHDQSSCEGS